MDLASITYNASCAIKPNQVSVALGNMEWPFIAIPLRSTLIWSGST